MRENWYDNGMEKQVDRWEERADGSKTGIKPQTLNHKL